MKVARKLLIAGGASLALAGGAVVLPLAPSVGATSGPGSYHHGPIKRPDSYVLKEESNATYNIKTEISPSRHVTWSTVTNKTTTALSPTVTFNGEQGMSYSTKPLDPGKSRTYVHFFTGNNFTLNVAIAAQGADTFTSSANVSLPEPVTFTLASTDPANRTATGTLINNSGDPQTVYLKNSWKNKTTETLAPYETRTITVSSPVHKDNDGDQDKRMANHHKNFIWLGVTTQGGYRGSYLIPLVPQSSEPVPLE